MSRQNHQFTTIRTEGALLPPDILQRIAAQKVEGMRSGDYHLPDGFKITEAITQSWDMLKKHWKSFQDAKEQLAEEDTGTSVTNERWLLPLFKELDYGRLQTGEPPLIEEKTYPIRRFYNHTPIHLLGWNLPLDKRTRGAAGAATASPHSMMQEFLNRSDEHLWAIVSNGRQLRILRDNVALSRQAYVEFDLEAMMEGEVYSDFALLWILCHQSRVEAENTEQCWLEKWSKLAREEGTRVLNNLRAGVADAIEALGAGFLAHPHNDGLRKKLQESGSLSKDDFYRQLLRIVYRLLFLFVAEDRELLHPRDADDKTKQLYRKHYSTSRLRGMSLKLRGSKHGDLWHSLSLIFSSLSKNEGCPELGLVGLGSFLWNTNSVADLLGPHEAFGESVPVQIANDDLLSAIRALAYVEQDRILRSVDYRNLGSEELGSVYESLLELHPDIHVEARHFELHSAAGNERKTSGSYYTPDSLVQCLLDSALDPVVVDRRKGKKGQEAEDAILSMKVCDPACGSGHFLIAAAHRLARHLARLRTGESEPSPEDHQHALRDVIGRCIYGVDINPMAVELCKVSLWIEAIEPGKPLSFLDHHIQRGNSLLGTTPALLKDGIPDDAFKPIEGDLKASCAELKKRNKKERKDRAGGQIQGYLYEPYYKLGNLPAEFAKINIASDDSLEDISVKQEMYERMVEGADYLNARLLADTWCAAFVWIKDNSDLGKLCPSERDFRNIENNPHSILPHVKSEVRRLADQYQFFHWHLAFPDVFRLPEEGKPENDHCGWSGGFAVVLGNPPWDKIQPEEQKFFASSNEPIATAKTGAKRKRLLAALETEDPPLFDRWIDYKRQISGACQHIKASGFLSLTSGGNLNSYRLFGELAYLLMSPNGAVGMVLQSGLATDHTSQSFLNALITGHRLRRFLDIENRGVFFPDVHAQFRFALVTLARSDSGSQFGWLIHDLSELTVNHRLVTLTNADLHLFNPTTGTCPTFKSERDLQVSRRIYSRGVHFYLDSHRNFAEVDFLGELFNMTRDSHHFVSGDAIESLEALAPLYEAKYVHQFDHRFASAPEGEAKDVSTNDKGDPSFFVTAKNYVPTSEVSSRLHKRGFNKRWFSGFRSVSSATNERTAIFSVIPFSGVGNSVNLLLGIDALPTALILGNGNSFVFDYCCREKMSGMNVNIWIMKQLPLIAESDYSPRGFPTEWIARRVLELTYTAWDLEAFALDCGYAGPPFRWDEERRFQLRCELDAAYFHLYLGSQADWGTESPQLREMFPTPRDAVAYIMETFPIVKRKDIARTEVKNDQGEVTQEGTYITKDTILSIYDEMQEAIDSGHPYQTRLDPPPGPPTDAEGNFIPMAQWVPDNWPSHIHLPRKKSEVIT